MNDKLPHYIPKECSRAGCGASIDYDSDYLPCMSDGTLIGKDMEGRTVYVHNNKAGRIIGLTENEHELLPPTERNWED